MYLSDFVSEHLFIKLEQGFLNNIKQMKHGSIDKTMNNFTKVVKQRVFHLLSGYVKLLNEPLILNTTEQSLDNYDWMRQSLTGYAIDIEAADWETVVYLVGFKTPNEYVLFFIQNTPGNPYYTVQRFNFTLDKVLSGVYSGKARFDVGKGFFHQEGTWHFTNTPTFAQCWQERFIDVHSATRHIAARQIQLTLLNEEKLNGFNNS